MSEQRVNLCDGCALWPCGSHAPIGVGGCIVTECANRKPTSGEQIATLKSERDKLLELAKIVVSEHPYGQRQRIVMDQLRTVIAKIEGAKE